MNKVKKSDLSLTDIVKGLEDGSIKIDGKNHNIDISGSNTFWENRLKEKIIRNYYHNIHTEKGQTNITCTIGKPKPTNGEITIDSDFVFANHFKILDTNVDGISNDAPKDKRWTDDYSLNNYSGILNITKHKSEVHNVAYGQMGNMGIGIYANVPCDHIIITESWAEDYESKKAKLTEMGMKYKGYISLDIWRWEATDVNTLLKQNNYKLEKSNKTNLLKAIKEDCDLISFKAKPGVWEFIHYYDTTSEPDDENELFIYSELKIKK